MKIYTPRRPQTLVSSTLHQLDGGSLARRRRRLVVVVIAELAIWQNRAGAAVAESGITYLGPPPTAELGCRPLGLTMNTNRSHRPTRRDAMRAARLASIRVLSMKMALRPSAAAAPTNGGQLSPASGLHARQLERKGSAS